MARRLVVLLLCLAGGFAVQHVTKKQRLAKALAASSQFAPINTARAEHKPMLVSVEPPGCSWAAQARAEIAKVQPKFDDRYVFLELETGSISTTGAEPFDYLANECEQGLCLFDPSSGKVKALDVSITAEALERELVSFAQR